jgi:hypothetical protein
MDDENKEEKDIIKIVVERGGSLRKFMDDSHPVFRFVLEDSRKKNQVVGQFYRQSGYNHACIFYLISARRRERLYFFSLFKARECPAVEVYLEYLELTFTASLFTVLGSCTFHSTTYREGRSSKSY